MSRTRTCTVVEASSSAAKGLKEDLASNLASAALAMSTSVTALATAAALMTAQQRALADAYAAPRGPLESLYGALADEVLQWCQEKLPQHQVTPSPCLISRHRRSLSLLPC